MTIDPPGARDLDQAMHLARRGGRLPRVLRDRRPRVVHHARRRARPRGARPRRDALPARREDPAVSAGALGGRGLPAARRVAAGGAVDDRPRRGRRGGRAWTSPGGWCAASRSTPTTTCRRRSRRCCARSASCGSPSSAPAAACGSRGPSRRSCPQGDGWTLAYRVLQRVRGVQRADLAAVRDGRGGEDAGGEGRHPAHAAGPFAAGVRAAPARRSRAGRGLAARTSPTRSSSACSTRRSRRTPRSCTRPSRIGSGAGYTAFDGELAGGVDPLGRRRALRARDGAAAAVAGPLRVGLLPRPARPGGVAGPAGDDGRRARAARAPWTAPWSTSSRP